MHRQRQARHWERCIAARKLNLGALLMVRGRECTLPVEQMIAHDNDLTTHGDGFTIHEDGFTAGEDDLTTHEDGLSISR